MLGHLEKAFYYIGDRVVSMSTGEHQKYQKIADATPTSPLVVTPNPSTESEVQLTRSDLELMTKRDIVQSASSEFGITLDMSDLKEDLIEQYLDQQ